MLLEQLEVELEMAPEMVLAMHRLEAPGLDLAAAPHDISWHWVKGHSGHPENERCDTLADAAARASGSGASLLRIGCHLVGAEDLCRLAARLAADDARLARAFVAHLTRYATGAEVSYADRAEIRRIVEETRGEGYRLRALIHGLARSRLFLPPQR